MQNNEQLIKDLTAKDEKKASLAAQLIIENSNVDAFQLLVQKSDFLFDFVKNNVNKRLKNAITKDNLNNLKSFLCIYCPDFEDAIIESFAKYANEDITDEFYDLLENGTDAEKTYSAKYFSFIPDTIAQDLLIEYSMSDNESLAFNSAKALLAMKNQDIFHKALELLKSDDEFTVLKAVKFLVAYEDKSAVKPILDIIDNSTMSENIAGEVPFLESLLNIFETDKTAAQRCLDNILSGLGEILPLNQIFSFEMYDMLACLIDYSKQTNDSQTATVLLKAFSKFEMLVNNEEYTFDEDKNTKQEISDIFELLNSQKQDFWNKQKSLIKNELMSTEKRISSALRVICEYKLKECTPEIKNLLETDNEILICEATSTLKQLGALEISMKEDILSKIKDTNKKALINSLF